MVSNIGSSFEVHRFVAQFSSPSLISCPSCFSSKFPFLLVFAFQPPLPAPFCPSVSGRAASLSAFALHVTPTGQCPKCHSQPAQAKACSQGSNCQTQSCWIGQFMNLPLQGHGPVFHTCQSKSISARSSFLSSDTYEIQQEEQRLLGFYWTPPTAAHRRDIQRVRGELNLQTCLPRLGCGSGKCLLDLWDSLQKHQSC